MIRRLELSVVPSLISGEEGEGMEVDSVTISQRFGQLCLGNDDLSFSLFKTFQTLSSFFIFLIWLHWHLQSLLWLSGSLVIARKLLVVACGI